MWALLLGELIRFLGSPGASIVPTRFDYLRQDSPLTLAEGLEEYSAGYRFLNRNDGSTEASTWFRRHDLTHVVFGTIPFEIRGETINDLWTIFGSDITIKEYWQFFRITNISYSKVISSYDRKHGGRLGVYGAVSKQILVGFVTISRALKMKKKWPWHDAERYLHQPLWQTREEFGITVINPSANSR